MTVIQIIVLLAVLAIIGLVLVDRSGTARRRTRRRFEDRDDPPGEDTEPDEDGPGGRRDH